MQNLSESICSRLLSLRTVDPGAESFLVEWLSYAPADIWQHCLTSMAAQSCQPKVTLDTARCPGRAHPSRVRSSDVELPQILSTNIPPSYISIHTHSASLFRSSFQIFYTDLLLNIKVYIFYFSYWCIWMLVNLYNLEAHILNEPWSLPLCSCYCL